MNRYILVLFGVLTCSLLYAQQLHYTIQVADREGGTERKISVDLTFYRGQYDSIHFPIANQINETGSLYRGYRNWAVEGGRIIRRDSGMLVLKCTDPSTTTMQLHYEIIQPWFGGAVTATNASGPIIQPDYFHIRGYTLLLAPLEYKNYEVTVEWKHIPRSWVIHNSMGSGKRKQVFMSTNREDWRKTNWMGGDFRIYEDEIFGKPVVFAVRGQWLFADTTLFRIIRTTLATQREQWEDMDIPYYSVSLIPFVMPRKPGARDQGSLCLGHGLYQSFVTYADPDCGLGALIDLFNHEMMHEWIGGKIVKGREGDISRLRWFFEGFTEYYALRNRLKAGFIDEHAFLKELNQAYLERHYRSEFAALSNDQAELRRLESFEMERLPYRRGCIAALYLDCAIRVRTNGKHSLFDWMKDLMEYTYGTGRNLTEGYDFFLESLSAYYGEDAEQWLENHLYKGQLIPKSAFQLPDFLELKTVDGLVPQFQFSGDAKTSVKRFLTD